MIKIKKTSEHRVKTHFQSFQLMRHQAPRTFLAGDSASSDLSQRKVVKFDQNSQKVRRRLTRSNAAD